MDKTADKTIQTFDQIKNKVVDFLTDYGFQIFGALIIVAAGLLIAGWLGRLMKRWLSGKDIEPPVRMLAVRVVRLLVVGLTLVIALDKCGVPIAPMIAGMSVVGVGVGLAVQGVLGNLVAGLNIIFTKPFRIGEYIEIAGVQGQVTLIELFSTTLQHTDQSLIVIPNKQIVGEILRNYGYIRQVTLTVGVGYGTDINAAVALVRGVLERNPRVLKQPAPGAGIAMLADSSINLAVGAWTKVEDYGAAKAELFQSIVEQFRNAKIEMPFPQREVRLLK